MNYYTTFFALLFSILIATQPLMAQAPFGPPTRPAGPMRMPQMSEAEAAKFQQEMAQFQKEFEALSKDEQDQFFKSMDEAVKKIDELSKTDEGKELLQKLENGTISDNELDALVNQLVGEEPPKPEEKKEPVIEKAPEPEKPKMVLTSKHEKAIDTINKLIAHTNAFIVKAATIPELPAKFQSWARKGVIKRERNQNWSAVKADIEQFISNVTRLLDRNPTTKEYYHLDELLKNETLSNNLQKIMNNVVKYEPEIEEIPLLGGKKMSIQSKMAFQKLLNEYHEAIHILRLNEELNKLFALFEPRAKALREQEEKALKQAELTGKRPTPPGAGVYRPDREYAPVPQRYGTPPQPSRPVPAYRPAPPAPVSTAVGPRPADAPKKEPPKPADRKLPEPIKEQKKEPKTDSKKEEATAPAQIKIPAEQEQSIRKIDEHLGMAATIIKDSGLSEKFNEKIITSPSVDVSLAVEILPDLTKELNIQKGALGELRRMHGKVKSKTMRSVIQNKLKKGYAKQEKQLNGFINAVDAFEKEWDTIRTTISPEKRYAYFGEAIEAPIEKTPTELAAIQLKVPAPYSLFEIRKLLSQVKEAISHFADDTLPGDKGK